MTNKVLSMDYPLYMAEDAHMEILNSLGHFKSYDGNRTETERKPNGNDPSFPTLPDGTRDVDYSWKISDTWKQMEEMVKKGTFLPPHLDRSFLSNEVF